MQGTVISSAKTYRSNLHGTDESTGCGYFMYSGSWDKVFAGSGNQTAISGGRDIPSVVCLRCLFSVLGISNRRKNGLKWAFVSIELRKNTYFNCVFTPCFAPESDLQN